MNERVLILRTRKHKQFDSNLDCIFESKKKDIFVYIFVTIIIKFLKQYAMIFF